MDKVVGQLVAGLESAGIREETLVLFYSDNGTDTKVTSQFRGEAIRGGKASPLQTGIRVPLIANWPGTIGAGQIRNDLVDASDFLPTLADLAKVKIPEDWHLDGMSFAKTLTEGRKHERDVAFFWYDPRPGWDKDRFSRHVFTLDSQYKLFSDERFFDISGEGFREEPIKKEDRTEEQEKSYLKLKSVLEKTWSEPLSEAAKIEVDAFGKPVQKP
jgi:arylsulfatase A-like enzyme